MNTEGFGDFQGFGATSISFSTQRANAHTRLFLTGGRWFAPIQNRPAKRRGNRLHHVNTHTLKGQRNLQFFFHLKLACNACSPSRNVVSKIMTAGSWFGSLSLLERLASGIKNPRNGAGFLFDCVLA